jgi:hypothetical protein
VLGQNLARAEFLLVCPQRAILVFVFNAKGGSSLVLRRPIEITALIRTYPNIA